MANEVVYVSVTEPTTTPVNTNVNSPETSVTPVVVDESDSGFTYVQIETPLAAEVGETWFRPTDKKAFVYYAGVWESFGGAGGFTYMQESAPSAPMQGHTWFRTSTGQSFVYYEDGSSNQWIQFGPGPGGVNTIADIRSRHTKGAHAYPGTNQPIQFDTQTFTTVDAPTRSAGTFTVVKAGLYTIDFAVNWGGSSSPNVLAAWLSVTNQNGTNRHSSTQVYPTTSGETGWVTNGSATVWLRVGDTFRVEVYTPSGAPAGIGAAEINISRVAGPITAITERTYCTFSMVGGTGAPGTRRYFQNLYDPYGRFGITSGQVQVTVSGRYEFIVVTAGLNTVALTGNAYVTVTPFINSVASALTRIHDLGPGWNGWTDRFIMQLNAGDFLSIDLGGEFWSNFTIDGRFVTQGSSLEWMSA